MKLNPSTAAKQFLRKQENRTANNQKRKVSSSPDAPSFYDKWGTGGKVIRNVMKQFKTTEAYMNRISKIRKVKYTDGSTRDEIQLIDNMQNRNKYTNGSATAN